MKESKNQDKPFIHLFRNSLGFFLYDVNKNKVIKIPYNVYYCLEMITKEELIPSDKETTDYINMLKYHGYLKSNYVEISEHPITELYDAYINNKLGHVTLQVTQKCNLSCDYCIYSGAYYNRTHADVFMPFDIAKESIDYVLQHAKDSETFGVSFYGGEPLLAYDLIKSCVEYVKERAEGRNVKYNFTTNGTLLTEEKFDFLVQNDFNLLISLDGPEYIHDRNRKFAHGGKGSHKVIMKNLSLLYSKNPEFYKNNVSFNTVLDSMGKFSDINDFIIDNEVLNQQRFQATFVNDIYAKEEITFNKSFIAEFQYEFFKLLLYKTGWLSVNDISPIMLGYFNNIKRMFKHIDGTTQEQIPKKTHRGGPCIPAIQKLFITVKGEIYPCERVSESSEVSKIGDIGTGINMEKAKKILNLEQQTSEACRSCWAYYYCDICISKAEYNDEISARQILHSCGEVKREVESNLQNYSVLKEIGYNYEIDL